MELICLAWGGVMNIGDVILDKNMKRHIIVSKTQNPPKRTQIKEFGEELETEWVRTVCIRTGELTILPVNLSRLVKPCGRTEYVQAFENSNIISRELLRELNIDTGDYEPVKKDQPSIFFK